jgi:hypothetical protein
MKNQEKVFNVTVKFTVETDYYETKSVDLKLRLLEETDKDKEITILEALSDLAENNELKEIEEKVNLDEATISKLAKKSKSLKEFRLRVHKKLVKNNIHSLRRYYEGRDGEPDITVKEVLECGAWWDIYGCKFEIEESDDNDDDDNRFSQEIIQEMRKESFIRLCDKKQEKNRRDERLVLGKEIEAIKERMRNVLLLVRETEDPIELEKLSTEFADLSKELSRQQYSNATIINFSGMVNSLEPK